jgi:phage internal scaffolding protein
MKKTTKQTENNKPVFRTAYGPKPVSNIDFSKTTSRTKQSFKDECNINKIIAKFHKTGVIDHLNKYQGRYEDCDGTEFRDAMEKIAKASTMFEELPSSIRTQFENDPAKFLDFTTNPENLEEMRDMGLAPPANVEPEPIPMPEALRGPQTRENAETGVTSPESDASA